MHAAVRDRRVQQRGAAVLAVRGWRLLRHERRLRHERLLRYKRLLRQQCLLRHEHLLAGHDCSRAVIAVQELREEFGFVGIEADDYPGLTPGLRERVAHITNDRLARRDGQAVQCAPLFPRRFQARCGALSTCDQLWITHRATLP
jgi:hypothetical protein